jgi:hypothetical protein
MNKIIQTSCSELLVDTQIHDPEDAFRQFNSLFKTVGWESSPPLSLELLKALKERAEEEILPDDKRYDNLETIEITVYDKNGNRAWLEYGSNGYITTGYRFDSHYNQGDDQCYPIFREAIERLGGEMHACDGGSTSGYEDWASDPAKYQKELEEELSRQKKYLEKVQHEANSYKPK